MQVRSNTNRDTIFDFNGFLEAVNAHRVREEMSWRQVSKVTGVSSSSLTRMSQGKKLDIDGLMRLANWAKLEIDQYRRTTGESVPRASTPDQVAALLRGDPNLSEEDASHLVSLIRSSYDYVRKTKIGESGDE